MIKDPFNRIKNTFLKLTSKTYPYGYEDDLVTEMVECGVFPKLNKDDHGNYFLKIGKSRTIFASHLDTACKAQVNVNHVFDKNIIRTDKTSILGADDKAGITIMLWMIKHNIPGVYYFFIGEEVGCIGSGLAAKFYETKGHFDRIISFDRRGTTSVITHQSSMRTCSDEFGKELSKQLNRSGMSFKIDDTGVYTDSAEFTSVIPECTNISVGYYQEHSTSESQDINHLYKLAKACLKVDWESLPTKRDINKIESKWDSTKWDDDRYDYGNCSPRSTPKTWNNSNYHTYGQNQNWNFSTTSGVTKSRTRRKRSKRYFDNGEGLLDLETSSTSSVTSNKKYEAHKHKFLDHSLNMEELKIIKNQYLDMNLPEDKECYNALRESIFSKNSQ